MLYQMILAYGPLRRGLAQREIAEAIAMRHVGGFADAKNFLGLHVGSLHSGGRA